MCWLGRDGALYFVCSSLSSNTGKLVRRLRDGKLETAADGDANSNKLEGPSPLGIAIGT